MLTDIDNWPSWNPDVKNVSFNGDVSVGSIFKWKAGPGTITSTFQEIYRPKLLVWTGKTLGIKAIHVWNLIPYENKTIITTEESWDRIIVNIMDGWMQKALDQSTESGLKNLKIGIEDISKS